MAQDGFLLALLFAFSELVREQDCTFGRADCLKAIAGYEPGRAALASLRLRRFWLRAFSPLPTLSDANQREVNSDHPEASTSD